MPLHARARRLAAVYLALIAVEGVSASSLAFGQAPGLLPRVRSDDSRLAEAIAVATERSVTFRSLMEAVQATDGLVYVQEGRCRHGVRACVPVAIVVAGPNRLLQVLVEKKKAPGCELGAVIGHELQHVLEVLREPAIRDGMAMFQFLHRTARTGSETFETPAAIDVGAAVARELCGTWTRGSDRDG